MKIIETIQLLHYLNDAGVNKAYELLESILHNTEFIQDTQEDQFIKHLNEKKEQDQARKQKAQVTREVSRKEIEDKYANEFKIIQNQNVPFKQVEILKAIQCINGNDLTALSEAYVWGFTQGKRAERARR